MAESQNDSLEIVSLVVHKIGNKSTEDGVRLSQKPIRLDESINQLLLQYFMTPFKNVEYYNFHHESDLMMNEVYAYASAIFDNPSSLYEQSVHIARHLYEQSVHPKIKSGELYVVYLKGGIVEGEEVDMVGIFKSETRETYLKVYPKEEGFEINYDDGININKLDKGCLIYNSSREEGYTVAVIDQNGKGTEAVYWTDDFLHLIPRSDNYHHTQNVLDMCKSFVREKLPESYEMTTVDQAHILNQSVKYFKDNDSFELEDFSRQVLQAPELIDSFKSYKEEFEEDNFCEINQSFEISDSAVKKQAKFFKTILKLDKNFHVYVHGNRDLIEKGYDDDKGKNFYKLYFNEEN